MAARLVADQERGDDALHLTLVIRAELPVGLDQDAGAADGVAADLGGGTALGELGNVSRGPPDGCLDLA